MSQIPQGLKRVIETRTLTSAQKRLRHPKAEFPTILKFKWTEGLRSRAVRPIPVLQSKSGNLAFASLSVRKN